MYHIGLTQVSSDDVLFSKTQSLKDNPSTSSNTSFVVGSNNTLGLLTSVCIIE